MNKKVLTAVVLGIVSSGYFSTISEAVMLDTVYVEADRIHDEYAGGFVDRGTDMGECGKTGLYECAGTRLICYRECD